MYKNGIIKWAEKEFSKQLDTCFKKYNDGVLTEETDETYAGGFWDLADDMHTTNPHTMEQDSIYYLLTDYYKRVKYNEGKIR